MRTRVVIPILVLVLTVAISPAVWATPPTTWVTSYTIHATPSDPNSRVTVVVHVSLLRSQFTSTAIGWEISSVAIDYYPQGQQNPTAWTDNSPTTPALEGLWWTQHTDPNSPQTVDFSVPPRITGTAAAQDPNGVALQYSIEGKSANGSPPYTVTSWLDYTFTLAGDPDPIEEGTPEPTETSTSQST